MSDYQELIAPEKYRYNRAAIKKFVADLSTVSAGRSTLAIATQWGVIAAAATAAYLSQYWAVYALAIGIIATRQHALGVLVHDAAHFRLYKNKTLNDVVSDFFLSHPLAGSTALYRKFHLDHHRYTNTDRDPEIVHLHSQPEWQFPKSRQQLVTLFIRDLTGLNLRKNLEVVRDASVMLNYFKDEAHGGLSHRERAMYIVFLLASFVTVGMTHMWIPYLLLWVAPAGLTVAILRLRMISEHFGVPNDCEITGTRTVRGNWLERLVFCPMNVNYHLEHHMFPSVPFYNLQRLHAELVRDPGYAAQAHITATYVGFRNSVLQEVQATATT